MLKNNRDSARLESSPNAPLPDSFPFEVRKVSNADLNEANIPRQDEQDFERRVILLAASFDGYAHWGSLDKCFEVGLSQKDRRLRSLTELRTELFCWYRTFSNDGSTDVWGEINYVRVMIEEIRDRVTRGVID